MPVTRRRPVKSAKFSSGPWSQVVSTNDPFDYGDDDLIDAYNIYLPDPDNGSGAYARPGFAQLNGGSALVTSATPFRCQGVFSFTNLSLATFNFVVMQGKLWRADATGSVFTDVSPAGITIDAGITTRVYGTTFITQLIVTDGVNRPWLLTNPGSTPVTGTYIDYDSSGTTWSAFGPFVVYAGSAFCILNQYNSVARRSDISWSLPADASLGWQQTNYDFNWTLEQSTGGSAPPPLYALAGDNTALTYWRESSIGSISGIPGPNLQGQATHDAISKNVGTLTPQSVQQYGTTKFFCDAIGRPYRLVPGQDPEPLWLQLRAIVDASTAGYPAVNKTVLTSVFEPTLNLYTVAPWSSAPGQTGPATEGYTFDGRTGKYFGRFSLAGGVQLETMGVFVDANGRGQLVIGGSAAVPVAPALAASGFLWGMNNLVATGDFLTTEAPAPNLVYLTTEDGVYLTTEGTLANWMDGATVPTISITTPRLGYTMDTVVAADRVIALVGSPAPVTVSTLTAAVAQTSEGIPTPTTTQDTISKLTVGLSGMSGRGLTVTLSPTTATSQWSCQQVQANAVVNQAAPDDV
jgi:hypothetical protein